MKKKLRKSITEIRVEGNVCPIPLESLMILMDEHSPHNTKFKLLSKKIGSEEVKMMFKHKESGERCKMIIPIKFLDDHKIPYQDASIPTEKHIIAMMQGKHSTRWEIQEVVMGLSDTNDLIVVYDKVAMKTIGCKMPIESIQTSSLYIEKGKHFKESIISSNTNKINIWGSSEWQREIQTRLNLSQLTRSTIATKA